jgi:hypothetical protein
MIVSHPARASIDCALIVMTTGRASCFFYRAEMLILVASHPAGRSHRLRQTDVILLHNQTIPKNTIILAQGCHYCKGGQEGLQSPKLIPYSPMKWSIIFLFGIGSGNFLTGGTCLLVRIIIVSTGVGVWQKHLFGLPLWQILDPIGP